MQNGAIECNTGARDEQGNDETKQQQNRRNLIFLNFSNPEWKTTPVPKTNAINTEYWTEAGALALAWTG